MAGVALCFNPASTGLGYICAGISLAYSCRVTCRSRDAITLRGIAASRNLENMEVRKDREALKSDLSTLRVAIDAVGVLLVT